ncbi:MAG: diadenylate cyclase CdaA [Fibrobacterota bacterium]
MELYRIGFLDIRLIDLLDITIVTVFFYQLISFLKGTRAVHMLFGVILLIIVSFASSWAQLKGISWLMSRLATVGVVLFIILFQPEIRRSLMRLGQHRIKEYFIKEEVILPIREITKGIDAVIERRLGALILIEKSPAIRTIVETGVILNAEISAELIETIFFNKTPLHDGAVVIQGKKITAAACVLPINPDLKPGDPQMGMRHKAGLSITLESNVLAIIVSEETGGISVAYNGEMRRNIDRKNLDGYIRNYVSPRKNLQLLSQA